MERRRREKKKQSPVVEAARPPRAEGRGAGQSGCRRRMDWHSCEKHAPSEHRQRSPIELSERRRAHRPAAAGGSSRIGAGSLGSHNCCRPPLFSFSSLSLAPHCSCFLSLSQCSAAPAQLLRPCLCESAPFSASAAEARGERIGGELQRLIPRTDTQGHTPPIPSHVSCQRKAKQRTAETHDQESAAKQAERNEKGRGRGRGRGRGEERVRCADARCVRCWARRPRPAQSVASHWSPPPPREHTRARRTTQRTERKAHGVRQAG
jgi:hypothetical protein